jgi:uncharacterized membrane-anchored protein YitT (DUF2179 family)
MKVELNRKFRKMIKIAPLVARAEWSTFIAVVLGTVIYTFGVMSLTVPFRFPDSGVTGVAVLINYTMGISLPLMVGAANVVLLVWAWRELSVRMVLWTIFSVLLMTVLMKVMDGIPFAHTDQKLLIALLSGAVKGYGGGLVLRTGGSMGGLDVIVLYLQKKYGLEIGKYNFYINMCVIGASAFVVGVENAMLGLVSVYAASVTIDHTISSFDKRRLVLVVTKAPSPVVGFITSDLRRGATVIEARGGYSGEDRPIVMCLLTRRQSVDLKRFLADNQQGAFMVIADANEVVGKGFKPWRSL